MTRTTNPDRLLTTPTFDELVNRLFLSLSPESESKIVPGRNFAPPVELRTGSHEPGDHPFPTFEVWVKVDGTTARMMNWSAMKHLLSFIAWSDGVMCLRVNAAILEDENVR